MRHTDIEKIFKNLEKNALSIARKMYDYDIFNELHDFSYYTYRKDQKFAVWIDIKDPVYCIECSVCGDANYMHSNYCPNCGARMDGEV